MSSTVVSSFAVSYVRDAPHTGSCAKARRSMRLTMTKLLLSSCSEYMRSVFSPALVAMIRPSLNTTSKFAIVPYVHQCCGDRYETPPPSVRFEYAGFS